MAHVTDHMCADQGKLSDHKRAINVCELKSNELRLQTPHEERKGQRENSLIYLHINRFRTIHAGV